MAALMGTAIERNTAMSSRNDRITTAPMTHSSRSLKVAAVSMPAAVTPPT